MVWARMYGFGQPDLPASTVFELVYVALLEGTALMQNLYTELLPFIEQFKRCCTIALHWYVINDPEFVWLGSLNKAAQLHCISDIWPCICVAGQFEEAAHILCIGM